MVGANSEILESSALSYVGMVRDFSDYEQITRKVIFRMVMDSPWQTVRLFFIDKPKLFVLHLVNAFTPSVINLNMLFLEDQKTSHMSDIDRKIKRAYVRMPWLMFLGVVGPLAANLTARRYKPNSLLVCFAALLLIFSFFPVAMTYPLIHLIIVPIALFFLCLLFLHMQQLQLYKLL